jgi:hypothetical protein
MEQENIDIPDELYPLALLMDELKHDEFSLRISAMKKLQLIAAALRQERCRDELIPFLEDVTQEDEDEVLTVLAEELANLVPYIGGPIKGVRAALVLYRRIPCKRVSQPQFLTRTTAPGKQAVIH